MPKHTPFYVQIWLLPFRLPLPAHPPNHVGLASTVQVPWLTVNSIPLGDDLGNTYKYVCAALGDDVARPPICFQPPDLERVGGVGLAPCLGTQALHAQSAIA
jgi:hypothetical protein